MLAPDSRTVAVDLLRPPPGFELDVAVLTTYSLDLETVLALPLAVLAQAERGVEALLEDPLMLLEALRQAGDRIHVFVDVSGIAIPGKARALYAMLESSIHPVRAPNGGAFHPKLWLARFVCGEEVILRVAVLSRNLTFDRSWDLALASEASPGGARRVAISRPLGDLLRLLPEFTLEALAPPVRSAVERLADEAERTRFPAPDGYDDAVEFHALGVRSSRASGWPPKFKGSRLLAVAPFANQTGLQAVGALTSGSRTLISRRDELAQLPERALDEWSQVLVLREAVEDEPDDEASPRPSGLHAKAIAVEHGWDVTWYVGSANLTAAAVGGRNVEVMASVTGRKGRAGSKNGRGIDRFLESGFQNLCEPYRAAERTTEDEELVAARSRIEDARDRILAAELEVRCEETPEEWVWRLLGAVELPPGIEAFFWPISVPEPQARRLALPSEWTLPISHITAFVGVRLGVDVVGVDDARFVLKVPTVGMPESRLSHILRALIDSPAKLLRFLRALLGGLEGAVDWATDGDGAGEGAWRAALGGDALLEDLVRAASRDPARLEPVRRLIEDLRATDEGRTIVPDDLFEIWMAVEAAVAGRSA